jgi:hypothetical protein
MREALVNTGLPWTIEQGSKHWILKLNGTYVAVLSYGRTQELAPNLERNILTRIRKISES